MEKIRKLITLDNVREPVSIIPFSDIHLGADGCNKKYLRNTVKWIENKENCYAIGIGDYCDCITIGDKRFDIKSVDKDFLPHLDNLPMEQLKVLEDILEPIKDKILCMIPGNHEDMFRIRNSLDIMHELNRDLGITVGAYVSNLTLDFNPNQFDNPKPVKFYLHHGWFSGRKPGGKLNQMIDASMGIGADVFIYGHSHSLITHEIATLEFDGEEDIPGVGRKGKKIFINSGTFMETYTSGGSGYAERHGYAMAKVGTARIDVYPEHKPNPDIHVRI